jgi:hypothetical protein
VGATEKGVFALAREAGIELEAGTALPWLSNRGNLNPVLAGVVPETTLDILSTIHQRLGGDESLLAGKLAGSSPRPRLRSRLSESDRRGVDAAARLTDRKADESMAAPKERGPQTLRLFPCKRPFAGDRRKGP